ncbi:hypothetical protein Z517_04585 [Fonsecaea pedrosoi CBS 271.37]|uniref:Unplaced genomic scaffold supercont1.3, whole genome shotgun sequence n=1 Tax=Fonsecaea pedrosoi CBS 271.37 TaxID=1442368 RepID=A0A0D2HAK0_9EURO|nr:uncharacterized protein Z517_04585 [Fonsecaea pedrosoi CBS 271.37]KIW81559.1 hypothetical protein Z517_04585 [Fonsecaea pedrosoi CBS 271.37]
MPSEVTKAICESEPKSTDTTDIYALLDTSTPEVSGATDLGQDSATRLVVTVPSGNSPASLSGPEAEHDGAKGHEGTLPAAIGSETAATTDPKSPLDPSNSMLDADIPISFEWSDAQLEDTHSILDNVFCISPFGISLGWSHQHEMALKYYDTDLCILPLTSDMAVNPFRIKGFAPEGSQLLLQSVLALCTQHQVNTGTSVPAEALEKRSRVSDMLSLALQNGESSNKSSCLLEAILILITLDCAISALGNWSEHIHKAETVFEAWGGASALNTPRLRAQASMLVWWDATLAMISRQGTRFNSSYLEHLFENEGNDGWSFYELTGCPTELMKLLVQLTRMAREKEIAASMEFLNFDMAAVLNIERQLLEWKNALEVETEPRHHHGGLPHLEDGDEGANGESPCDSESEDDQAYFGQRNNYHCMEAWRYALLLYVQRVFKWDRQSHRRPAAILPLIWKVLEHSRSCHETSQAQKQLLIPMFLAGAEARNEAMRDTVRSYCLWWAARSRYGMFCSVSSVLEEYWEQNQSEYTSPLWWGSFLDMKSHSGRDGAMQYLFG